jgi:thiamine-monophosphate kinase
MDVSDGLLLDCGRMASASGTTLALDSTRVPVAHPARRGECLRWGDDYELLFTLPAGAPSPVSATAIGRVTPRADAPLILDGVGLVDPDGLGYGH